MNIKNDLLPLLSLGIITISEPTAADAHENNQHIILFHHRVTAIPCPFVRPIEQFDNSHLNCSTFKMPLINTYALSYSTFGEIMWHSSFVFLFSFRIGRTLSSYAYICRYNDAVASLQCNFNWSFKMVLKN